MGEIGPWCGDLRRDVFLMETIEFVVARYGRHDMAQHSGWVGYYSLPLIGLKVRR